MTMAAEVSVAASSGVAASVGTGAAIVIGIETLSSAVTFGLMYCFGHKGSSPLHSLTVDSLGCVILGAFTFFIVMPLVQYRI